MGPPKWRLSISKRLTQPINKPRVSGFITEGNTPALACITPWEYTHWVLTPFRHISRIKIRCNERPSTRRHPGGRLGRRSSPSWQRPRFGGSLLGEVEPEPASAAKDTFLVGGRGGGRGGLVGVGTKRNTWGVVKTMGPFLLRPPLRQTCVLTDLAGLLQKAF